MLGTSVDGNIDCRLGSALHEFPDIDVHKGNTMRVYMLGAVLIVLAGWGYMHARQLSDSAIADFYVMDSKTTAELDVAASCALVADDFHGTSVTQVHGETVREELDKAKYCDSMQESVTRLREAAEAAHVPLNVSYNNQQNNVAFAADHRSATVDVSYQFTIGRIHISGKRTDQLVKRDGKVLLTQQDDHSEMSLVMR